MITSTFCSTAIRNRPITAGHAPATTSRPPEAVPIRSRPTHHNPSAVARNYSGVPRHALLYTQAGRHQDHPEHQPPGGLEHERPRHGLVRVHALEGATLHAQAGFRAPRWAGSAAAAHAWSMVIGRDWLPSSTATTVTTKPPISNRLRHTARVSATLMRPSATSRATATCSADPGMAKITNVDTRAARDP